MQAGPGVPNPRRNKQNERNCCKQQSRQQSATAAEFRPAGWRGSDPRSRHGSARRLFLFVLTACRSVGLSVCPEDLEPHLDERSTQKIRARASPAVGNWQLFYSLARQPQYLPVYHLPLQLAGRRTTTGHCLTDDQPTLLRAGPGLGSARVVSFCFVGRFAVNRVRRSA